MMMKLRAGVSRLALNLLIAAVRAYRLLLSPWLGSSCRFEPTCSAYALQALERHGAAAGTYLSVCRIARCHPWCDGGHDAVPDRLPTWLRRYQADASGAPPAIPPSLDPNHP